MFSLSTSLYAEEVFLNDIVYVESPTDTDNDGRPDTWGVGAAYIFKRDAVTGSFAQQHKLTPSLSERIYFGEGVAIYNDTVVVGAPRYSSNDGMVFVFNATTGEELGTITASTSGSAFGTVVAIEGDKIVVGAPRATVDSTSGAGIVYVYQMSSLDTPLFTLKAASPTYFGEFGSSVDISGNNVVVGCSRDIVHVFSLANGGTSQPTTPTATFATPSYGFDVAIEGNLVVVGDTSGLGKVRLYDLSMPNTVAATYDNPEQNGLSEFGSR